MRGHPLSRCNSPLRHLRRHDGFVKPIRRLLPLLLAKRRPLLVGSQNVGLKV